MEKDNRTNKVNKNREIEDLTENIREMYGIIDYPVEPTVIAKILNIPIQEVDFKMHDGYIVSGGIIKESNKFKIYINRKDTMNRKRFTIAHELGHYFLHHLSNKGQYVDLHKEETIDKNIEERQADMFAAALLMPRNCICEKYNMFKILGFGQDTIIDKLSRLFLVSKPAVRGRLKKLNLIK